MGSGDVVLVVLARAGQTNSATTLDLFLPTSGDRQTGHPTGPWWSDATARAGYVMTTTTMTTIGNNNAVYNRPIDESSITITTQNSGVSVYLSVCFVVGVYFIFVMFICAVSLCITMFVLRLYHHQPNSWPMPNRVSSP